MILAGDIGGTKTLLALFARQDAVRAAFEHRFDSHAYPDFGALVARFLDEARAALGRAPRLEAACLGVAGPVAAGRVQVTNLAWALDAAELARRLGLAHVQLINDFAAVVVGLDAIGEQGLATLQAGEPIAGAPRVVLGAGTGLGIAYAFASEGNAYRPLSGEGGHAAFAPTDETQIELWRHLHERVGRVTLEHVISGTGLLRIYDFLLPRGTLPESAPLRAELSETGAPAAITRHALERGDALALAALDLFITCYGAAAGDHALNVLARGGVYIAGGIAPKILKRLTAGGFLAAFNDKAGFAEHARRMPVHVVVDERAGLLGAARLAMQHAGGADV